MAELLPEFWGSTSGKEASQPGTSCAVTDIATWIQCFATYISVMSASHPGAVPELLALLIFILRGSQDFGGIAWVTYDGAFRQQALITGNRHWSKVNLSLYSICFSGVAHTGQSCDLCLSLSHPTRECTLVSDPDPDLTTRLSRQYWHSLNHRAHRPHPLLIHRKLRCVGISMLGGAGCPTADTSTYVGFAMAHCRQLGVRSTEYQQFNQPPAPRQPGPAHQHRQDRRVRREWGTPTLDQSHTNRGQKRGWRTSHMNSH